MSNILDDDLSYERNDQSCTEFEIIEPDQPVSVNLNNFGESAQIVLQPKPQRTKLSKRIKPITCPSCKSINSLRISYTIWQCLDCVWVFEK